MYNVKLSNGSRHDVVDYILQQKSVSPDSFSVVDVGGSMVGWSAPYVDAIIDFEIPCADSFDKKLFKCDITHPSDYSEIMEYVETHGKFDFCICTHVLEDIMNPGFVCEQICKIAKGGYIAFPSKYRELSRFEGQYRGHIHHRWIFTIKNEVVYGFPKINYLETNFIFDRVSDIVHASFISRITSTNFRFSLSYPDLPKDTTIFTVSSGFILLNAKRTIAFLYSPRSNKYFPILKHICAIIIVVLFNANSLYTIQYIVYKKW